jgi:hypothetical protein
MSKEKLIAISGMPGLFKMVGNRSNGLIVEDLDSGKRKFVSMRKHQFSPLETIAIFTYTDSVPLTAVLDKIYGQRLENPPISGKASGDELRTYFRTIVPDHDEFRVFPRDIKKIIRWYEFLAERDLFESMKDEEE